MVFSTQFAPDIFLGSKYSSSGYSAHIDIYYLWSCPRRDDAGRLLFNVKGLMIIYGIR